MLNDKEVFSFNFKSLTAEADEKNFEMLKAEHWYKQQRPPEDRAFDDLVALVSDPCEVCFEMNHMVQYVKCRVHPIIFESWNPPHMFAEFWIQKQAQLHSLQSKPLERSLTKSALQYQWIAAEKPKVQSTPEPTTTTTNIVAHNEPPGLESSSGATMVHRAVPGFQSILQCGANTLYGDTKFLGSSPASYFTVTPTAARINRLFQETTAFTQYETQDSHGSTSGAGTPTTATMVATPTTERINNLFQDTISSMRFLTPHADPTTRSEDAENEPPALTIATDPEDKPDTNQSLASESPMDCGVVLTQHGETSMNTSTAPSNPPITSNSKGDFSIFYDPLGLETSTQPRVTERVVRPPNEKRRPLLPTPVLTPSTTSAELNQPPDAQIFSRDPRLRSKKVTPNADPPYTAHTPLQSNPAPFTATMIVDQLERIPTTLSVGDSLSCAMNSPTTFFRHLLGLNAAQGTDRTD